MLETKQLRKHYVSQKRTGLFRYEQKEVQAVNGVDLVVQPGQIVGLLGVNGAGKTTTIKMLSTLIEPTFGTITMDGIDVVREPMRVRSKINMIAGGERMLYWRLTGRENLEYFGRL